MSVNQMLVPQMRTQKLAVIQMMTISIVPLVLSMVTAHTLKIAAMLAKHGAMDQSNVLTILTIVSNAKAGHHVSESVFLLLMIVQTIAQHLQMVMDTTHMIQLLILAHGIAHLH